MLLHISPITTPGIGAHELDLFAERKDDQILRMEIVAGGETGGEWMSAAHGDEPNPAIIATVGLGGSAYSRTSAGCSKLTSGEILIAGR